jgi:hypothetical protein
MDHNWPYVAAGYALTAVVVAGYAGWLQARLRRTRRSAGTDTSAPPDTP